MKQISWTAKKSNETMLQKVDTTRSLTNRICKRQATFFDHTMRREKHLMTTRIIEGKSSRENSKKRCGTD